MSANTPSFSFEESLDALETIVERLESGDLSLEEALQAFEKGIALTRQSQQALNQAQVRINVLLEQNGEPVEQSLQENTQTGAARQPLAIPAEDEEIPF